MSYARGDEPITEKNARREAYTHAAIILDTTRGEGWSLGRAVVSSKLGITLEELDTIELARELTAGQSRTIELCERAFQDLIDMLERRARGRWEGS